MLGFEVRVELTSAADNSPFTAQITRGDAEALGLKEGDTVYVRATRVRRSGRAGADTETARRRPQRGGSPRHVKLLTYFAMSRARKKFAPDGWPEPNSGLNSRNGPAAAAINA